MHGMKDMFRRHLVGNVSSQRIHGLRFDRHSIHLNFKICAKSMAESSKKLELRNLRLHHLRLLNVYLTLYFVENQ